MFLFNINSYPFINEIYQQALYSFIAKGYYPTYCMIENGKKILNCIDEINSYQSHYFVHHTAKLDQAFNQLNLSNIVKTDIQIYDWGCGQGLGTLVFLEKMFFHFLDLSFIKSITFIDPSEISLKSGKGYIESFFATKCCKSPKIRLINNAFDKLSLNSVEAFSDNLQFHILSNIIDINTYDMCRLTKSISDSISLKGLIVIVSPDYSNTHWRIQQFEDALRKEMKFNILMENQFSIYADVFHVLSRSNKIVPVKNIIKIYKIERSEN